MVFKVKKKAHTDYWKVTADSQDDDRFKFDFAVGRKAPEYSYNWPYDFFSLVELARIEGGVDIMPPPKELVSSPTVVLDGGDVERLVSSAQTSVNSATEIATNVKNIFGWSGDD